MLEFFPVRIQPKRSSPDAGKTASNKSANVVMICSHKTHVQALAVQEPSQASGHFFWIHLVQKSARTAISTVPELPLPVLLPHIQFAKLDTYGDPSNARIFQIGTHRTAVQRLLPRVHGSLPLLFALSLAPGSHPIIQWLGECGHVKTVRRHLFDCQMLVKPPGLSGIQRIQHTQGRSP